MTVANLLFAAIIYIALAAASLRFNLYIDQTPDEDRPDGLVALWVGLGIGYTGLGVVLLSIAYYDAIALFMAQWQQLGLVLGLGIIGVTALLASGLPMLVGDIRRSHMHRQLDILEQITYADATRDWEDQAQAPHHRRVAGRHGPHRRQPADRP